MKARVAVGAAVAVVLVGAAVAFVLASRGPGAKVVTSGAGAATSSTATPAANSPLPVASGGVNPTSSAPAASGSPVACGTLNLPLGGSSGQSVSASARLGAVSATLAGTSVQQLYGAPALDPATLTISVGGVQALSTRLTEPTGVGDDSTSSTTTVVPWSLTPPPAGGAGTASTAAPGTTALCLARFAGDTEATVLVGMDTGGAHCCSLAKAYAVAGSAVAPPVQQVFGDPDGTLTVDGDHAIVVTADDTFAYRYCSFACSGLPIEVLEFTGGTFANTTRQHPELVASDAQRWWKAYQSNTYADPLGVLAAWAADQCTLGQGSAAFTTLNQLAAQGKLTVAASDALPGVPDGSAYVVALKASLGKQGYGC